MFRSLPLALLGAALLSAAPAEAQSTPCLATAADVHEFVLPAQFGTHVVKLRAGPVLEHGANAVVALTDAGVLLLLRDAINAPVLLPIAVGVTDFAVASAPGQLARVITVGLEGLKLGAATPGGDGTLGASIEFSAAPFAPDLWAEATRLDVAHDAGWLHIVAAASSKLLRAQWSPSNDQFVEHEPTIDDAGVEYVALADLTTSAGLELAFGTNALIKLHASANAATLPAPYGTVEPLLGSFIDVQRIPLGADLRDSLGLIERAATTDVFRELTASGLSAPIASGALRASDAAYGPMDLAPGCTANCPQTDMALAMSDGDVLVLSGQPQAAGGVQFGFDLLQLHGLSLAALLNNATLSETRIASGDLDGDGDGDVACAALVGGAAKFVVVRNNCAVSENSATPTVQIVGPAATRFSVPTSLVGETQLRVALPVSVRKPNTFSAPPSHARVRMFTRKYDETRPAHLQDPISPILWYERTLSLSCPSPFLTNDVCTMQIDTGDQALPVDFLDPEEQLTVDNTLIYVEITPLLEVSENEYLSALPTNWVGSHNHALLVALICDNETDEFSVSFPCATGAPLINEIHRRKRIRPVGTPPQ